jgi:hypothetical protein
VGFSLKEIYIEIYQQFSGAIFDDPEPIKSDWSEDDEDILKTI